MIKKDISRQKGCLRSAGENKGTVSHPILFHFVPWPCAFISLSALVMQVLSPVPFAKCFLAARAHPLCKIDVPGFAPTAQKERGDNFLFRKNKAIIYLRMICH